MKTVIVYDSWYKNTEELAKEIRDAFGRGASLINAQDGLQPNLMGVDMLVVGSPTHGGVATPAIEDFMHSLKADELEGIYAAAFDTRVPSRWVRFIGFASDRIGRHLKEKGASLVGTEGFIVRHKKGPLKEGELERAKLWALGLKDKVRSGQPAEA